MAKQNKAIHLITMYDSTCKAICDVWVRVRPVDKNIIKRRANSSYSLGTFDPNKVTCKRCLKHGDYKTAMDKIKYPLFTWKENM